MQKNKIIEQKAKLLDDGFIYFDNKGHQVKITFDKDEKSQMLEKSDKRVFIEKFNKKDDIELLVIGNKVKENIIINKQRESYKYVYNLELTNLLLEEKNGKFYFLDKFSKEQVFKLSEFIMFDEDNKESKNIKVKTKQINENRYELVVRPNKEWINSGIRKLPVVVDPSVETVATQFIEFSSSTFSSLIETDSKARVGIKGKQAHALNMKINYGLITNELNIKNLNDTKYEVFLELHYDSSKSKSGSSYKTYHSSMVFNYVVDDKNTFRINLTKLVGVGLTELTLPFVHTNASNAATLDDDYIDIYTTEAHGEELRPRLVFEYKEIDSAPIHTKEFSSPTAGTTFLDLQNGSFIHKVNVGSIKHNALSMGLDLVLNSNLLFDKSLDNTNKHLAKGWKTNFHQYIKKLNGGDYVTESNNVVYMDGDGFIHRLTDSWYYLIDNVKHYVHRNNVYLDFEQNLKTKANGIERDVFNECISDEGLIYIPNRGSYNFKVKTISTKQKRYYIMIGDKKIYVYIDNNKLHIPLFVIAGPAHIFGEKLSYSQITYEDNAFRYTSDKTRLANIYEFALCDLPVDLEDSFYVSAKDSENFMTDVLVFVEESEIVEKTIPSDNEDINNVLSQINNIKQYINNITNSIDNYRRIIESTYESLNYQLENCEVNDTYLPVTQIHLTFSSNNQYIEQLYEAIDQLNYYDNLLKVYESNYQRLLKREHENVVDLLLDKNNNLLGFDGDGKLMLIQDGYGSTINVVYGENEDKDKIISIESETEKLLFEYDSKDSLSKIIDQYGRIVKLVDGSYNGYDTLYLTLGGEEVQFFNSTNIFYINEPFGKVRELHFINEKVIKIVEYFTGDVDSRNNIFSGIKEKGTVNTYVYNDNLVEETITKIHNSYYNKVNTYKFDGAGRLIKGVSHKNDHIINEFDGKHLIGEYSFNEDTDVFIDLKEEGLAAEKTILTSDNPTGLFAYVIEHNDTTSTMKNVKFNFSLYKVDENGSYTFIKTIQKTMYTYDDTIILPFRVPKGCKVYLNPYNSTTIPSDNITKALLVKLNGTQYVYDKEDHLVKSLTGVTDTIYEDFYHDNPTKVTTTDLQHDEVMVSKFNYDSNNRLTYQEDYLGNVEEIIFSDKGQVVEKRTYNKKEPTLCNKERFCYDEKGNMVTLDGVMKDSYGNIPSTKIEYLRGLQSKVKSPSGLVMNYGYDFNTDQLLSLSSEVDGVSNVNRFKYKRNLLESIEHDGFKVSYTHDKLGRRLETKVNDETYLTTEYNDSLIIIGGGEESYGSEIKNTYNNGHVTRSVYDIDGRIKMLYSDSNYKTISYDDRDNVTNIVSNDSYINKSFTYDEYDNVLTETDSGYSKTYEYDDRRRVSHEVNTYYSKTFNYDYTYNDEVKELLDEVVLNVDDVNVKKELEYDSLNRVSEQSLIINDEEFIKDEFEYLTVEDNALSLVKEHNILFKGTLSESNTYEYDLNGNIIKVVTDDDETRYHYDSLNRLIREDNPSLVKTYVYKYDKRGNILLRKEYNYTLEKDLFNPIKVDKFTYSKDGWKDQLVKYNDEEFVYDSMGRPTTYRGMTTYWNTDGTLSNMGGKYSYIRRNMDGMFFERRVGVSPYSMLTTTVQDDKILSDGPLTFIYILEKLVGFIYNGSRYYYQRNIQGDITHIFKEDGTLVTKYVYDAYGRHKVLDSSLQEDINTSSVGNLNPFRYRGYFYDSVLGLYFLKSRYYDPETCRFISPDIISILDETSSSINGLNLYMYCGDNPVMYVDPTGHFPVAAILIGLAVSWAVSSIASYFLGEHLVSGASSVYGGVQTIATGVSLLAYGPVGWVLGGAAIVLGAVNIAFGTAELQQHFTGNNWINDIGITGGLYTVLYVGSSIASSVVSIGGNYYKTTMHGQRAFALQNVKKFGYTDKVSQHMMDSGYFGKKYGNTGITTKGAPDIRPYTNSLWAQKTVIKYGIMTADEFGFGWVFTYDGYRLGINNARRLIWHFGQGF